MPSFNPTTDHNQVALHTLVEVIDCAAIQYIEQNPDDNPNLWLSRILANLEPILYPGALQELAKIFLEGRSSHTRALDLLALKSELGWLGKEGPNDEQ